MKLRRGLVTNTALTITKRRMINKRKRLNTTRASTTLTNSIHGMRASEDLVNQLQNDAEEDRTSTEPDSPPLIPLPVSENANNTFHTTDTDTDMNMDSNSDDDEVSRSYLKENISSYTDKTIDKIQKQNVKLRRELRKLRAEITTMHTKQASSDEKIDKLIALFEAHIKKSPPAQQPSPSPPAQWSKILGQQNVKSAKTRAPKHGPPPTTPRAAPKPIPITRQERTLICKTLNDDLKTKHSAIVIRDTINNALKKAAAPHHIVVAEVSFGKDDNLVMRTRDDCKGSEVLTYIEPVMKAIHTLDNTAATIQTTESWSKIAIHGIPTEAYGDNEEGMTHLRDEIMRYNSGVHLLNLPRFMVRPEGREGKEATSFVLSFTSEYDANKAIKNGISVYGIVRKCTKFYTASPSTQCTVCWQFGHAWQRCRAPPICRVCSENHSTRDHHCLHCNTKGLSCIHIPKKCALCTGPHMASDRSCVQRKILIQARPGKSDGPNSRDGASVDAQ